MDFNNIREFTILIDNKQYEANLLRIDKEGELILNLVDEYEQDGSALGLKGQILFRLEDTEYFFNANLFVLTSHQMIVQKQSEIHQNRKSSSRKQVPQLIAIISKKGIFQQEINASVINLSKKGANIETNHPLSKRTSYFIKFQLEKKYLPFVIAMRQEEIYFSCMFEVRNIQQRGIGFCYGIIFEKISLENSRLLDTYLHFLSEKPDSRKTETINTPMYDVIDDYLVKEKILTDSLGTIYRTTNIHSGQMFLMRILAGNFASVPSLVKRFEKETPALVNLKHLNIIQVLKTGTKNGLYYLIMEYIKGEDLNCVLQKQKTFYPITAIEIISQVCSALEYAHKKGILHRNIAPSNIFITEDATVKVMNFGMVNIVGDVAISVGSLQNTIDRALIEDNQLFYTDLTFTTSGNNTIAYMSPEQKARGIFDASSDIYSVGIVFFEMLTGKLPPATITPGFLDNKEVSQNIPENLNSCIAKLLAHKPSERYSSAGKLYEDLQKVKTLLEESKKEQKKQLLEQRVQSKGVSRNIKKPEPTSVHLRINFSLIFYKIKKVILARLNRKILFCFISLGIALIIFALLKNSGQEQDTDTLSIGNKLFPISLTETRKNLNQTSSLFTTISNSGSTDKTKRLKSYKTVLIPARPVFSRPPDINRLQQIVKTYNYPVYLIDKECYVSVRSLMNILGCENSYARIANKIYFKYKNTNICIDCKKHQLIIGEEIEDMKYPPREIHHELLLHLPSTKKFLLEINYSKKLSYN